MAATISESAIDLPTECELVSQRRKRDEDLCPWTKVDDVDEKYFMYLALTMNSIITCLWCSSGIIYGITVSIVSFLLMAIHLTINV